MPVDEHWQIEEIDGVAHRCCADGVCNVLNGCDDSSLGDDLLAMSPCAVRMLCCWSFGFTLGLGGGLLTYLFGFLGLLLGLGCFLSRALVGCFCCFVGSLLLCLVVGSFL